ncbi:hypothetical protein HOLleu_35152 [Holothuria leucospilota]|uniref:Uncharacterized protein n=1 Tax=Holothuria leucospilota TaxID=206669 RepID=A0A9Q1BH68_HOLLE|nr:hypothetical protein HOLleu_35152 [Holothuria leucospilota]
MAATGPFFLTVCFALLITVLSLQCYTKLENECSPSGQTCDLLAPSSGNVPNTVTECDADVTMCGLVNVEGTVEDVTFKSEAASCLPKQDGADFLNGCYDRNDLERIDPDEAEALKQLEELTGITFNAIEICICDGNLCNGSMKSVFSISVIISSVVMSFMLFM